MLKSNDLRIQHDQIIKITSEITKVFIIDKDSVNIFQLFSQLTKILLEHLTSEDDTLYPLMLKSDDLYTKKIAKEFQIEMGDIAPFYIDFTKKYSSSSIIEENIDECYNDTKELFKQLIHRIIRENNILFPAYDNLY